MSNIKKIEQYIKESDELVDIIKQDTYNYLVKILNNTEDKETRDIADMYLSQYNTAGGRHIIEDESVNFIYKNRKLIPELKRDIINLKLDKLL